MGGNEGEDLDDPWRPSLPDVHKAKNDSEGRRTATYPFGLPTLTEDEQADVDKDTGLIAKQMWLFMVADAGRGIRPALDGPQDPKEYVKDTADDNDNDLPSLWSTDMWRSFEETYDMRKITLHQGALGHRARKPTSLGTNLALDHLHGKRDPRPFATPVKDCRDQSSRHGRRV